MLHPDRAVSSPCHILALPHPRRAIFQLCAMPCIPALPHPSGFRALHVPLGLETSVEGRSVSQPVIPAGDAVCPAFIQTFSCSRCHRGVPGADPGAGASGGAVPGAVPQAPLPRESQPFPRCECPVSHGEGEQEQSRGNKRRETAAQGRGVRSLRPASGSEPSADVPGVGRTRGSLPCVPAPRQVRPGAAQGPSQPALLTPGASPGVPGTEVVPWGLRGCSSGAP